MEQIQAPSHERWLSVDEISQHLGVSKVSIYRWAESASIPAHKVGRQWKFQLSEVNAWVRSGGATDDSIRAKNESEATP